MEEHDMNRVKDVYPTPEARPDQPLDADWVYQMRSHFSQFGTYREEDLRRVLGEPNQHVEVQVDTDKNIGSRLLCY